MVAINVILLPECTGEGCGGDNNICTDSRVHHRNAENRAPVTRNHRSAPILGRWPTRDPIGYQGGINLYGYVDSSPVGSVDASGEATATFYRYGPIHYLPGNRFYRNYYYWSFIGQWDLSGSPSAGLLAEAAKDFASLSDTGRIVNLFMQTFSGTSATFVYNVFVNWKVTRVYTYKCIENGHPTDVKYQSTTRKDLHISFTPAPQHWGGTSGNLGLKQTQSELRADFTDIVKEIYEAYTEGQE